VTNWEFNQLHGEEYEGDVMLNLDLGNSWNFVLISYLFMNLTKSKKDDPAEGW